MFRVICEYNSWYSSSSEAKRVAELMDKYTGNSHRVVHAEPDADGFVTMANLKIFVFSSIADGVKPFVTVIQAENITLAKRFFKTHTSNMGLSVDDRNYLVREVTGDDIVVASTL